MYKSREQGERLCAWKECTSSLLRARQCLELQHPAWLWWYAAMAHATRSVSPNLQPAGQSSVGLRKAKSQIGNTGAWQWERSLDTCQAGTEWAPQESQANPKEPKCGRDCAREHVKWRLAAAGSAVQVLSRTPVPHWQQSNSLLVS